MLDDLLQQVKQAIYNDPTTPQREGYDPSGLIARVEGLFRQWTVLHPAETRSSSYAYADNGEEEPDTKRKSSGDRTRRSPHHP